MAKCHFHGLSWQAKPEKARVSNTFSFCSPAPHRHHLQQQSSVKGDSRWQNLWCHLSTFTNFWMSTWQSGKQAEPSMLSLHQCTNLSLAAQAPLYGLLLRAYWRCSCGCTWGIPQRSFVPVYKPKENRPHQKEAVKMSQESKRDSRDFSAYFVGRSFLSSRNMRASAES